LLAILAVFFSCFTPKSANCLGSRCKSARVAVIAVNMEMATPTANVMANPLTIDVPNNMSTQQAIKLLTLLSKMEVNARLNPASIAE
jgi:hypothetical protein